MCVGPTAISRAQEAPERNIATRPRSGLYRDLRRLWSGLGPKLMPERARQNVGIDAR